MSVQMRLRDVPDDIRRIILTEQARLKTRCNCQRSLDYTIYSLIRRAVRESKKKPETV